MEVTELGMIVFLHPEIKSFVLVWIRALQLFLESYTGFSVSTTICSNPEQQSNGLIPIEVTELGIMMDERLSQPQKATPLIDVTELGIIIEMSPLQPQKAPPPIVVTELGMIVFLQPEFSSLELVLIIALQLFLES